MSYDPKLIRAETQHDGSVIYVDPHILIADEDGNTELLTPEEAKERGLNA